MRIANQSTTSHWERHAIRWDLLGPPLRPSPDDLAVIGTAVSELLPERGDRGLDVLILGVTPEYARFPWPAHSRLVALEKSESMIEHVWPGSTAATERVIQGDWLLPPERLGPFDLLVGDGVLSMLEYPGDHQRFCRVMHSLTRPGSRWVLRLFVRPQLPEDPQKLLDDVLEGRLTNINEFKLRLGMALCGLHHADDVAVEEMWQFWDEARRQRPALQARWRAELQSTIENYRGSPARYSFPRLSPVLDIVRGFATIRGVHTPGYPGGACCPMVVLER